MMASTPAPERRTRLMRTVARSLSAPVVVVVGSILVFETIEGLGGSSHPEPSARAPLIIALIAVALAGLVMGWRWERLGGAVTVASTALLVLVLPFTRGSFWVGGIVIFLGLFGVPGTLFLLSGLFDRRDHQTRRRSPSAGDVPTSPRPIGPRRVVKEELR